MRFAASKLLCRIGVFPSEIHLASFTNDARVVPFTLTQEEALNRFDAWHRSTWFAPSNLSDSDNLVTKSIFFPFWCFESEMSFSYCATPSHRTTSGETKRASELKGTLPNELLSFQRPEMQVYASYKHRRDFAAAVKLSPSDETSHEVQKSAPMFRGVELEKPMLRQGMAWELALRNVRQTKRSQLEHQLKAETGATDIEDIHLEIKVTSRRSQLYFFPAHIIDYTYSRSYSSSGALQENKFQTIVGGTTAGRVSGERHYCPKKTRAAASLMGAGIGAGLVTTTDTSLSMCIAETSFWTFMAATFSGLYAKYSTLLDRWHQINQMDKEHQRFTKEYFKQFTGEKDEAFSDYQDCLRCESEWKQWEELQKWDWKEDERHKWGESLWKEQHKRRRDNIKFRIDMQQQKIQREQERRRDERRRQKYGYQDAFHHHGIGEDFAWSRTGGGNRDAFGYYALLNLDPTGPSFDLFASTTQQRTDLEAWSDKDIKDAFQKKALQCHPDKHAVNRGGINGRQSMNLEQMREQFQLLSEAYEVLKDPKKKERYDRGTLRRHDA